MRERARSDSTPASEDSSLEADDRLEARLTEIELAHEEGHLAELVKDTPSVRDQLRRFLDAPSSS